MKKRMNRKRKISIQEPTQNGTISTEKRYKLADVKKTPGTIERMLLKNFMCHSLMEVHFLNNISIVIGRNGSGKSAILTALIVGLGGRANLTNRGNSIKNFIKAGRNQAVIEIELYNGNSCMSYQPDIYGDCIVIVRQLNVNGASSYKIKNSKGETVSKNTKELKCILTAFNIQIDNPVCILNQDISRNFLNSNNPKYKFSLFIKATQLDTLMNEHEQLINNKLNAVQILNNKEVDLNRSKEELNHLKRKIDNHRHIVDYRKRIKLYKIELFWAKVRDSESDLNKKQHEYDELNGKLQQTISKTTDRLQRIENLRETITDLERQIEELQNNASRQSRPCSNVQRLLNDLKDDLNKKSKEKQMLQNVIRTKTDTINNLKREIANNNENVARVEEEKIERLQKRKTLEEKTKSLEEHLQTYCNELYQISNDFQRLNGENQYLQQELTQTNQKIHNEQGSLNALQNESTNNLSIYGREMAHVKQLIEQYKDRFKQLPRGPIGTYIRLKDKKWAIAVESHIGRGLLNSFLVDNINDNRLLMQIFEKCYTNGRHPSIITNKFLFKKYDIAKNLVVAPHDCVSFYDALDIQDTIVSNCLIDKLNIERLLLIPNDKRAMELMSNYRNVPKNCQQSLTINGDRYYPDPNFRTYSVRFNSRVMYLQTNKKDIIDNIKNNIELFNRDKLNFLQQIDKLKQRINEQQNKKRHLEDKIKQFKGNKLELRRQLEQLNSLPEPEIPSIKILESELNEIQLLISQKQAQLHNIDDDIRKTKQSMIENQQKYDELEAEKRSLDQRINKLNTEIKSNTSRSKELETNNKFEQRQIDELKQQLNDMATNHLKQLQKEVENNVEKADNLGERIETDRQVQEILNDMKQLERTVHTIEIETDSVENVEKQYNQLFKRLKRASITLEKLKGNVKDLESLVETSKKSYKLTEQYFVTCIRHTFKRFMEIRQFHGTININIPEKSLEIVVLPKQQQNSQKTIATSNLSGGERSFSTVAFLYSLWQCMEFPFYFLDEFDVYMDKLNRTQVLNILIEHAKTHSWLQYVFLTPQDVSFVDRSVNVLRLEDPAASS